MIDMIVSCCSTLIVSFFLALYFRSVAKEYFKLKRALEGTEISQGHLPKFLESSEDDVKKGEKDNLDDVAYMKAYV